MINLTSEPIAIDRIKRPKHRKPDEEIVCQLMHSIPLVGLLQPIILHRPGTGLGVNLVAGLNRLEACHRLKMRSMLARVVNGDTKEIREWIATAERDENLIRRCHAISADPNIISLIDRRRSLAS